MCKRANQQQTAGDYDWKYVYQQYHEVVAFGEADSRGMPIIGSWVINGQASGIGIREDRGITSNTARFVPHLISEAA